MPDLPSVAEVGDMSNDELRDRLARTMMNADNGAFVAYLECDEPELLDTDRVIDGTINFAKLADVVVEELPRLAVPNRSESIFTAQRALDELNRKRSHG